MKKIWILCPALAVFASACAWRNVQPAPQNAQSRAVVITDDRPSAACAFKGGIMGDQNADSEGWYVGAANLAQRIRVNLQNNAVTMGGNTVWVRRTGWNAPQVSTDYYRPFYINEVQYSALVYDCPNK